MKKNVRRAGAIVAAALFSVTVLGGTSAHAADTSWGRVASSDYYIVDTSWGR